MFHMFTYICDYNLITVHNYCVDPPPHQLLRGECPRNIDFTEHVLHRAAFFANSVHGYKYM